VSKFTKVTISVEGKTYFDSFYRDVYLSKIAVSSAKDGEAFIKHALYTAFLELQKKQKDFSNGTK
jgi:hypothetical protein